jgi:ABC-type transporter Mla MlaB component
VATVLPISCFAVVNISRACVSAVVMPRVDVSVVKPILSAKSHRSSNKQPNFDTRVREMKTNDVARVEGSSVASLIDLFDSSSTRVTSKLELKAIGIVEPK